MIPRVTTAFYRLPPELKPLYGTGMPMEAIEAVGGDVRFKNFRIAKGVMTTDAQMVAYRAIESLAPDAAHTALFCSQPDRYALLAASALVRKAYLKGFREIEFVHPSEHPPRFPDESKALYIVMGLNDDDPDTTRQARRWFYTPHGAAVWGVVATADPYLYAREKLGKLPEFLFALQPTGIAVG